MYIIIRILLRIKHQDSVETERKKYNEEEVVEENIL